MKDMTCIINCKSGIVFLIQKKETAITGICYDAAARVDVFIGTCTRNANFKMEKRKIPRSANQVPQNKLK